jgi:hypothetical protein
LYMFKDDNTIVFHNTAKKYSSAEYHKTVTNLYIVLCQHANHIGGESVEHSGDPRQW